MKKNNKSIIILGAGPAGLALAYELIKQDTNNISDDKLRENIEQANALSISLGKLNLQNKLKTSTL